MSERGNAQFDPVIHAPWRLQICTLLDRGGEVEFGALRALLQISDAMLSKHLKTLADSGYVELRRAQRARGHARTWVRLTPTGSKALDSHFAFLIGLREEPATP